MDDRVPSSNEFTVITPPVPTSGGVTRSRLTQAARFLEESSKLDLFRARYQKYRRYATLNLSEMFASMVPLYEQLFKTNHKTFQTLLTIYSPAGVQPWTYAARVWLSAWIRDLYATNREAVRKLSSVAFSERYMHDLEITINEYDEFLVLLNASIRPTHINYASEDTLYIPLLADTINWEDDNPFNVTNFTFNEDLAIGIRDTMKEKKGWVVSQLSTNTLGRPCWLYDWHGTNEVCSWFHSEANFNMEDITLAYIVGVACTPKLGPRDPDDWQNFPNNVIPAVFNPADYNRVVPRRFFGSYEVRTFEDRNYNVSMTCPADQARRRKVSRSGPGTSSSGALAIAATGHEPSTSTQEEQMEIEVIIPQFRITDWVYYYRVVHSIEMHTRTGALRTISLSG